MKKFVGVYLSDDSGCGMEVKDCFVGESEKEVIDKMIEYEREFLEEMDEVDDNFLEDMGKSLEEEKSFSWEDDMWGYSYLYMIKEEY